MALWRIRTRGVSYYVLNSIEYFHGIEGLGNYCRAIADSGFLGCATKEIGKYFGIRLQSTLILLRISRLLNLNILFNFKFHENG